MSVTEKAKSLADELTRTSEYREMLIAEQNVQDDEEARNLIDDFQSMQQRLQLAQSNGTQVSTKQQKKIQSLQSKMQNNPLIKNLLEKQKQFHEVMETVNQVITSTLREAN